jgi:hypothetical protein
MYKQLFASLFCLSAVVPAHAATFAVTTTNPNGPGSLREAIAALNAAPGNTHVIDFQINSIPSIITLDSEMLMIHKPAVGITSSGLLRPTISGADQYRIIDLGPEVALFTITDVDLMRGATHLDGACLNAAMANTIVTRVKFTGCTAQREGGAIFAEASLTVRDSTFIDNQARSINGGTAAGGAISKMGTGNLIIEDSLFDGNMAWVLGNGGSSYGGAVALNSSSTANRCIRCRFVDNESRRMTGLPILGNPSVYAGGAFFVQMGNLRVEDSVFRNGYAQSHGGAIASYSPDALSIINTTISGNYSRAGGGGVVDAGSGAPLRIVNSVFDSNGTLGGAPVSPAYSGAHLMLGPNSNVEVYNSAFGSTQVSGEEVTSPNHCSVSGTGGSLSVTGSWNVRIAGEENCGLGGTVHAALHLGSWMKGTSGVERRTLLVNSPLLDAGSVAAPSTTGSACYTSDIDGTARPQDSNGDGVARCSIGPYESTGEPSLFANDFES